MRPSAIPNSMKARGSLAFVAAALLGWILAAPSRNTVSEPETLLVRGRHAERRARNHNVSAASAAARQRMAGIRAAGSEEARMRATVEFANALPVTEFAAWLEGGWFNLRDGPEQTLFKTILMDRWKLEDPEALVTFTLNEKSRDASSALAGWAETQPQQVIDYFKKHPNDALEIRTLAGIANSNPSLALQRLQEMANAGIPPNASGYLDGVLRQLAKNSPAALNAALDSFPGSVKSQAESALIGQRLETSFTTEIRALWERPDGWKIFVSNAGSTEGLGENLFKELGNLPPTWKQAVASHPYNFLNSSNCIKWFDADWKSFGFTDEQVKSVQSAALNYMYLKPEEAFKRMAELELDTNTRQNLITNAVSRSAQSPEKTEALIAILTTDEDRQFARKAVDSINVSKSTATLQPAEWLDQLSESDPSSNPFGSSTMPQWDQTTRDELIAQFKAMPEDKKQQAAQAIATQSSNYQDNDSGLTGAAISYLVKQPPAEAVANPNDRLNPIILSSIYVAKLVAQDPAAATQWVETLPDGEAKLWAQRNLATNWKQYDPQAADRWVQSLPPAQRDQVVELMKKR